MTGYCTRLAAQEPVQRIYSVFLVSSLALINSISSLGNFPPARYQKAWFSVYAVSLVPKRIFCCVVTIFAYLVKICGSLSFCCLDKTSLSGSSPSVVSVFVILFLPFRNTDFGFLLLLWYFQVVFWEKVCINLQSLIEIAYLRYINLYIIYYIIIYTIYIIQYI